MSNIIKFFGTRKTYLFLFLIVFFLTIVIAQTVMTMSGGSVKAVRGVENVPYPVFLENDEFVAGFQVEISYTPFLLYNGIEPTSRMSDAVIVVNN